MNVSLYDRVRVWLRYWAACATDGPTLSVCVCVVVVAGKPVRARCVAARERTKQNTPNERRGRDK